MSSVYYRDEHVTLYHGNCMEVDEWLAADVLVTDPPYGVAWGGYSHWKGSGKRVQKIAADHDTGARDKALEAWGKRPAVVFGSWKQPRPDNVRFRLIWDKRGMGAGPGKAAFKTADEEVYIIGGGFKQTAPPVTSVITTWEVRGQEVRKIGHPTPKPVGLMELLVDRCPPGVIADPFAGSGSTLIAARNLGRKAIGVEMEERYCEIAARRLSEHVLDLWGGGEDA